MRWKATVLVVVLLGLWVGTAPVRVAAQAGPVDPIEVVLVAPKTLYAGASAAVTVTVVAGDQAVVQAPVELRLKDG